MKIKSVTDIVLFVSSCLELKEALVEAVFKKANLHDANLYGADLRDANLRRANLRGADLRDANLHDANLYGADLRDANLRRANLRGADLRGADLRDANLHEADLRGADLRGAKNANYALAQTQFIPETGQFEAWKKCRDNVLVKLLIPDDAKRSHGMERKCRCSKAIVLDVIGADQAISMHDSKCIYRKGETILPDSFDDNRWETCSNGIHFFITRLEAEKYEG